MDFLMGIFIGTHIGKILVDCLEKYLLETGIIDKETDQLLEQIECTEQELIKGICK